MPEVQWTITAAGFFAATLGFCLLAIIAHDARRRRRSVILGAMAVAFASATVVFTLLVTPQVQAG